MNVKEEIDDKLFLLCSHAQALATIKADAEEELERVRYKYAAAIAEHMDRFKSLGKEVKALGKENKGEVFGSGDRAEFRNGLLVWGSSMKVQIPRDALGKIEAAGWMEAVKVAKSVDRDVVQAWPDERLEAIGAKQRVVETVEYELRK